MLAMPGQAQNLYAAQRLAQSAHTGLVAATAQFNDQIRELEAEGVDAVFNFYTGAGSGFAEHVAARMDAAASEG